MRVDHAVSIARVRAAVAAREGALAAFRHSPNSDTARALTVTTKALDYRLEQLWEALTTEQREMVDAR